MLQQIDPDALSYRRNGSISTESALDLKLETTTFERPRALSMPTTFETWQPGGHGAFDGEVRFASEARERSLRGIDLLANAVRVTLGPKGRNVVIDKSW